MELKFGVLGVGHFGSNYLRLLKKNPEAELISFGDASLVQSILNNPQINCVVIATPPSTHFALAKEAIQKGKHVLLEKPMAINPKEAEYLEKIVGKNKKVFMVGHQYLFNDHIKYLSFFLKKKSLGKIYYVFAEHLYPGPIRSDVGCFFEAATHQLSIIDFLFKPKKILSIRGKNISILKKEIDDFSLAHVVFDTISISMINSWFAPEKTRRFIIVGEKGFAVFDDQNTKDKLKIFWASYPSKNFLGYSYFFKNTKAFTPSIKASEPLRSELDHFIYCIKNKKKPLTDIQHGLKITKWLFDIKNHIV